MNELSKHRNAFPWHIPGILWRYLRLHWRPRLLPRVAPNDGLRVVISLTTVPSRLPSIRTGLASLLDQTRPPDEVVLALPRHCLREGRGYELPCWLEGIRVLECERDFGPATKLIPALRDQSDPRTLLIFLDDDNVYPVDMVETMLTWHRRFPDAALGYRALRFPPSLDFRETPVLYGSGLSSPRPVDVLTGTWGVLVQPRFFPASLPLPEFPEDAFFVDDIWINGQLARAGIDRWIIPARSAPLATLTQWKNDLGRFENANGRRDNPVIASFREHWLTAKAPAL